MTSLNPANVRFDNYKGLDMHYMVDLETLGTGPKSVIASIGVVSFNETDVINTFYREIDVTSCQKYGLEVDLDTVKWWMGQSDEARKVFKGKADLKDVLLELTAFLSPSTTPVIWGNGANFDNVILRSAYSTTNLPVPWTFYNDRCFRTVKAKYKNVAVTREGTYHNALDDARYQVKCFHEYIKHGEILA